MADAEDQWCTTTQGTDCHISYSVPWSSGNGILVLKDLLMIDHSSPMFKTLILLTDYHTFLWILALRIWWYIKTSDSLIDDFHYSHHLPDDSVGKISKMLLTGSCTQKSYYGNLSDCSCHLSFCSCKILREWLSSNFSLQYYHFN